MHTSGRSSTASRSSTSFRALAELPAETDLSKTISKDLKRRGFRFVGPTGIYAFMQTVGMVDDHTVDCFRRSR